MPWKDPEKKRAADRRGVARKRQRLREQKRLNLLEWHRRQLTDDHDWQPHQYISLRQWREGSRAWLRAERERESPPLTEADMGLMRAAAEAGLAVLEADCQAGERCGVRGRS